MQQIAYVAYEANTVSLYLGQGNVQLKHSCTSLCPSCRLLDALINSLAPEWGQSNHMIVGA